MHAAVVQSFAAPPSYTTFPDPEPAENEQLVDVTAVGLHPIVKSLANGTHYGSTGKLPFIPGVDGAGRLQDGTRVLFGAARPTYGTFAERTLAGSWICIPIPDGLDDVTAAGIANPGMSSWAALAHRAQFRSGEKVLILGATGSAGQLAVQIAKRFGASRIIAAGRNPKALQELASLGADATISLDQSDDELTANLRSEIALAGIDVVLDYLWGHPAELLFSALLQKGLQHSAGRIRYIQIGESAGKTINLPAATLRSSGLELLGSGFGSASMDDLRKSIVDFLNEAAKKPFQANIQTAPLRDVERLWNQPEHGTRLVFQP